MATAQRTAIESVASRIDVRVADRVGGEAGAGKGEELGRADVQGQREHQQVLDDAQTARASTTPGHRQRPAAMVRHPRPNSASTTTRPRPHGEAMK